MLIVQRDGVDYDLAPVESAVDLAVRMAHAKDEYYAARNGADIVRQSPVTQLLHEAEAILLRLRMGPAGEPREVGQREDVPA